MKQAQVSADSAAAAADEQQMNGVGCNDFVITIQDEGSCSSEWDEVSRAGVVEQDLSLSEVKDFEERGRDLHDLEAGGGAGYKGRSSDFWKQLEAPTEDGSKTKDEDKPKMQFLDPGAREPDVLRQAVSSKDASRSGDGGAKSLKLADAGGASIHDVLKGGESIGKGFHSSVDRLHSLKVPPAVVALAQAAAKVNDLPGWPLLSPAKPQLQKCEKCAREFFSTLNYRRHIRLHRRSAPDDKDLRSERSHLAAFWNKLSAEEAGEIVSFKNLVLENLSGASAMKALASFIQQAALVSFPIAYVKAGSTLLDIVQTKVSAFPLSADDLLRVLDDGSEGTFLCGGTSVAVQRFIYHGEVQKVGLEDKNLVASLSFLIEIKLIKAWMAARDAEALRCEKALVEEEEAAQRKRAKILEKKRQKKNRQKRKIVSGQVANGDADLGNEEVNSPGTGEEDDFSLPTASSSASSVVSSGQDILAADFEAADEGAYKVENESWNNYPDYDTSSPRDESFPAAEGEVVNFRKEHEAVDQRIGKVLRERKRSGYFGTSTFHWTSSSFQSNFKPRRAQTSAKTDHSSQPLYRRKLGGMHKGIAKGGSSGRAVWARKVNKSSDESRANDSEESSAVTELNSADAHQVASPTSSAFSYEEDAKETLLVGSLNIPLGGYLCKAAEEAGAGGRCASPPAAKAAGRNELSASSSRPAAAARGKVWRAVGKVGGESNELTDAGEVTLKPTLPATDSLDMERAVLRNVNTCMRPSQECDNNLRSSPAEFADTASALAEFLQQRWSTAAAARETVSYLEEATLSSGSAKAAKVWPLSGEQQASADVGSKLSDDLNSRSNNGSSSSSSSSGGNNNNINASVNMNSSSNSSSSSNNNSSGGGNNSMKSNISSSVNNNSKPVARWRTSSKEQRYMPAVVAVRRQQAQHC